MQTFQTSLGSLALAFTTFCSSMNVFSEVPAQQMATRSYKINMERFVRNLKRATPPKADESNQDLLRRFFKQNQIDVEAPAGVWLNEDKGLLLLRVKASDMKNVEAILSEIINGTLLLGSINILTSQTTTDCFTETTTSAAAPTRGLAGSSQAGLFSVRARRARW